MQLFYNEQAGTTNPGETKKHYNPLKRINNSIPWNPGNPFKGIGDVVPNGTRIQCPRWSTVQTKV